MCNGIAHSGPYAANTVRNVELLSLRKNEAYYMLFSIKKVSWKREIQCILSFYKKNKMCKSNSQKQNSVWEIHISKY